MARPSGPKTRNGGTWTESKWTSFIKNQLRQATRKWPPIHQCTKDARVGRGIYRCAECQQDVPASIRDGRKKVNNIYVDHIVPIVDPKIGWTNWDDVVERMFCEIENLQLLCKECHDAKCNEERAIAVQRRRDEKEANNAD